MTTHTHAIPDGTPVRFVKQLREEAALEPASVST